MSDSADRASLSEEELSQQAGTALPDKEVVSILDLNADLDLALNVAAPIDLAVAANANVAAPIDAAVAANILSVGSNATALADQGVIIDQGITGDATADSTQDSVIDGGTADPSAAQTGTDPAVAETSTDPAAAETSSPSDGTVPDGTLPGGTLPDGTLPDGNPSRWDAARWDPSDWP